MQHLHEPNHCSRLPSSNHRVVQLLKLGECHQHPAFQVCTTLACGRVAIDIQASERAAQAPFPGGCLYGLQALDVVVIQPQVF